METKVRLTLEDLRRLDNYGHRELEQLTESELDEYATLLQMRRQEVLERIRGVSEPQESRNPMIKSEPLKTRNPPIMSEPKVGRNPRAMSEPVTVRKPYE